MVIGILIASVFLVFGFLACLLEPRGWEPSLIITNLLALAILVRTLTVTTPPKSDTEKLKELQNYCVSIGVATMTPVVTTTEFKLLPPTISLSQLEYVVATGVVQIKGEAE